MTPPEAKVITLSDWYKRKPESIKDALNIRKAWDIVKYQNLMQCCTSTKRLGPPRDEEITQGEIR